MTDSIDTWAFRLSAEPLPVMRRTLTRVRDLLYRSSASHSSIRSLIEFDPGFVLYLFRQLNRLPNRPKEPINKLGNALPLLGMGVIEQALQELPVLEDRLKGPPRRGLLNCYSKAAHASIYARELARRLKFRDADSLATAAILHGIGEMAMWNAAPEIMRRIQGLVQQGDGREDAALEVLGFTLESLNQKLGSRWQLPAMVRDCQEPHNSFLPQPLTVMLACAVARDSAEDWLSAEIADHLELLAEFLEIDQEQAASQLHQTAVLAARKLHGLPLPAFRLAYAAAGNLSPRIQKREIDCVVPDSTPAKAALTPVADEARQQEPPRPRRTAPSNNPLHESLTRTVDAMTQQMGFENVMFAMLTKDRSVLSARFTTVQDQESGLKDFQVSLMQPNLFSLLMKKPQAIWLHPGNLQKYRPMIPQASLDRLCGKGFLAMSIFIKEKPIGLFYADNAGKKTGLSEAHFNNFKVLCQRFMQQIA